MKIYVVTFELGEYTTRSSHIYASYATEEQAQKVVLDLEKMSEWLKKAIERETAYLYVWNQNYIENNPKEKQIPPSPKKGSKPEWNQLNQKEWLDILSAYTEEVNPIIQYNSDLNTARHNSLITAIYAWWREEYTKLPEELLPYKDFENADARNISVNEVEHHE
jgi:hypothetical protein